MALPGIDFSLNRRQTEQSQPPKVPPGFALGDNLYESAAISFYNTLRGDPSAAVRSLLAPSTLTPDEHQRLLGEVTQGGTGITSAILRTITNPIVLVGAALAFKWPVTSMAKWAKAGSEIEKYSRWVPAPLRKLMGLNEVFAATPVPTYFHQIAADSSNFLERHFMQFGKAADQWRALNKRGDTVADQVRWFLQADPFFDDAFSLKQWNKQLSAIRKTRGLTEAQLPSLTASQFRPKALPGDELVVKAWRDGTARSIRTELESDPARLSAMSKFMYGEKGLGEGPHEVVEWIRRNYVPRVAVRDQRQMAARQADFLETMASRPLKRSKEVTSSKLLERVGRLPPSPDDLKLLGDSVDPAALRSLEALRDHRLSTGKPGAFSLRFAEVLNHYGNSIARAFAWNNGFRGTATSTGELLLGESRKVAQAEAASGIGLGKAELLHNVYIPMAMGRSTFQQSMKALEWGGIRRAGWELLNGPTASQWLPETIRKPLANYFQQGSGFSYKSAGSQVASWFYLSTLGAGVGPATQNLLQPILTTAPVLGIIPTMRGMASVIGKIPQYTRLVTKEGLSRRAAIAKLFPEFEARQLDLTPAFSEMLGESLEAGKALAGTPVRGMARKATNKLMTIFQNTELFNRLSTFEAARISGKSAGLAGEQLLDAAQEVTNLTQLWAGPAALPAWMQQLPTWSRQFLTFPTKYLGFMGQAATNTQGPVHLGTLGRAAAYSAAAYEMVRGTTGGDLSRSLMFGALPTPEETGPFAPFPIVPPVIGLAGSLGLDLVRGEGFTETSKQLPLLVPGGLQAAKFAQVLSPDIARAIGRTYADRSQRTPDGRVPMFNPDGQLIGHKTDWEVWAGAAGVPGKALAPSGDRDEQQLLAYILSQREQISQMRREYIQARVNNDFTTADRLRRSYVQQYGAPLEVRDSDLKAAQLRQYLPRLDRVLQSMPADVRPLYQSLAATAMAGAAPSFYGVDPNLLQSTQGQAARSQAYSAANRPSEFAQVP